VFCYIYFSILEYFKIGILFVYLPRR